MPSTGGGRASPTVRPHCVGCHPYGEVAAERSVWLYDETSGDQTVGVCDGGHPHYPHILCRREAGA